MFNGELNEVYHANHLIIVLRYFLFTKNVSTAYYKDVVHSVINKENFGGSML